MKAQKTILTDNMQTKPRPSDEYIQLMTSLENEAFTENTTVAIYKGEDLLKCIMFTQSYGEEVGFLIHTVIKETFNMRNAEKLSIYLNEDDVLCVTVKFQDGEEGTIKFATLSDDDYDEMQEADGTRDLTDEILPLLKYDGYARVFNKILKSRS